MIGYIVKLFKALNSNSKPSEIAHAFCLGLILGFMPKNNLLWYLLFVLFLFVRINKGGYFIMMAVGALIAPLFDVLFDKLGYFVLTLPQFRSFFSWLIDVPFVGFTNFNSTIVCGSLAAGVICYVPIYIIMLILIKLWRTKIAIAVKNSKAAKALRALPLASKIVSKVAEKS